jgi:hypothetical protein
LKPNGYQILPQDIFEKVGGFGIRSLQLLLFIYLRGLCAKFQSSAFFWKDAQIESDLRMNHKALQRARKALQDKNMIKYVSGKGKSNTVYKILPPTLLPMGLDTKSTRRGHLGGVGLDNMSRVISKSNQIVINKISAEIFKGMTKEEKKHLKEKGIL